MSFWVITMLYLGSTRSTRNPVTPATKTNRSSNRFSYKLKAMIKQPAMYTRMSAGEQTPDNHLQELRAVAGRVGWRIAAEYVDHGIGVGTMQRVVTALFPVHRLDPKRRGNGKLPGDS